VSARILFVSNGNGEAAIADRLAREVRTVSSGVRIDHLALVGEGRSASMSEVGPQRSMPSGGIIAMGNVANIARDVAGGLLGLTLAQRRFLVRSRNVYDATVAVGDIYALLMALANRAPVVYVGTAKSVLVAPYGGFEERVLRRARAIFVRDAATAKRLQSHRVAAEAPGNVIVDLYDGDGASASDALRGYDPALALFPGSRETSYDDALFLTDVVAGLTVAHPALGAVMSVAPTLSADLFVRRLRDAGHTVVEHDDPLVPFSVVDASSRAYVRAWRGPIGSLLGSVALVMGQAGTANEAAAAAGIPIVAFERKHDRKTAWYRMRQHGLLGGALTILPGLRDEAVAGVNVLLNDATVRAAMGEIGRERMGAPGGAKAIARRIVEVAGG
jgi:uncharacterized protein (TIGR03492 family)